MLHWLVVNNYTRGNNLRHYVMKPPPSDFQTWCTKTAFPCHLLVLWTAYSGSQQSIWGYFWKVRVVALWSIGGNRHPLCSYSPPISGAFNVPQILRIGWTRLDAGVHQTLSDACEEWVWVTRLPTDINCHRSGDKYTYVVMSNLHLGCRDDWGLVVGHAIDKCIVWCLPGVPIRIHHAL